MTRCAVALLAQAGKRPDFRATLIWINGMPGFRIDAGGAAAVVSLAIDNGRITRIYLIGKPHKLTRLDSIVELRR